MGNSVVFARIKKSVSLIISFRVQKEFPKKLSRKLKEVATKNYPQKNIAIIKKNVIIAHK